MKHLLIAICLLASALFAYAQQEIIELPTPVKTGGKPLFESLNGRLSSRDFSGKELDNQTLSNLLWSANGFNRPDKRTAPSSQDRQEIDIYVMFKDGVYFYDAKENKLLLYVKGDLRGGLGSQAYVNDAAVNLVFVANLDKASNREAAFIDTGYISENVYLFCASEGLGTVARGSFSRTKLPPALKLTDKQEVTLVQAVGFLK